ncbi:MAG TPA: 16S rRNA (adenine(1518)-N(6)/adenine(1519)-N(6))-dimethyltransferase RsmA [Acidimicrobiia bacterium]|nr:16S rRNA (adenine(1518)-N(6)/adenine(1519)-N(6))-dimethyltransferase RsmA [Acidimicrobiia bacterium]
MEMLTPATVRGLLDEHGIHPKKSLGQHFLADPNTARRVAALAEVERGDRVLEVGPGLGSLTLALAERGARVLAVEVDPRLASLLESVLAGAGVVPGTVDVRVADAMTVDWPGVLAGASTWSCVSNLPYNVAVPVVIRLLESAPAVSRIVVMVQREVGERLAAAPGHREYGAVSVKVAYHAEVSLLGTVPPSVFVPRPKVESALVGLRRRTAPPVSVPSEAALFELVRSGFAQRRKMLRRSLQPVLGTHATDVLAAAHVPPTARAESLGLDDWAAVARSAAAAA